MTADLYREWESYLAQPENDAYLHERPEGKRGWIPRWMILDFIRAFNKDNAQPRP